MMKTNENFSIPRYFSTTSYTHTPTHVQRWHLSFRKFGVNEMHHASSHRNANSETRAQDSVSYLHTAKRKGMEVGLVVLCFSRMINTCIFITPAIATPEGAIQRNNDDSVKCWKSWHCAIISFTNLYIHTHIQYLMGNRFSKKVL